MSDGMEGGKNERLIFKRDIEEEEMRRELTGMGIYEPGITYEQMKTLFEFVNESRETSIVASNNKNVQEGTQCSDNECLPDGKSDVNMQQEVTVQEFKEMPRPSYSYRLNRTSPTTHERKTGHYINSPESPSLSEARNPTYRRKSSDSDELFDVPMHSTNRHLSLRSENVSRECQNTAEKRTMQDGAQIEVIQKLEKWRLNPLDVSINENDVPLRQPNRSAARERMPFEHCKEAYISTSEQCEVIRSVSQHLKEMADLWYNWRPITNTIFQWGSPIQVGATNDSLDKKPLTDSKTKQITAEYTQRDGYERVCKRKANTIIANLNKDSSTEDEDDIFGRVKKKRAQSNAKSNQHARTKKAMSNMTTALSDDNNDTNIDNERVEQSSKRNTDENDERMSPELSMYPRRITPPNPKKRLGLNKQRNASKAKTRRTNKNKATSQAKAQKKCNTLTTEEIRQSVEEDWIDEEEEEIVMEKSVEIRPLPLSKETQSRLREKSRLSLSKTTKETQAATKEEEEIEESEEEQNKKKKPKFFKQKRQSFLMKEAKEELRRIENRNGNWERLLSDNEDESPEVNQSDAQNGNHSDNAPSSTKISCPICNKLFPHDQIENHAANCEQFDINEKEYKDLIDNDSDQLECNICSNYKTTDGVEYDEHVRQCLSNRIDQRHSSGSEAINTTSTSSLRTSFIPNSEQTDSEIDCLGQFPSNSKKNVHTNRKRKR